MKVWLEKWWRWVVTGAGAVLVVLPWLVGALVVRGLLAEQDSGSVAAFGSLMVFGVGMVVLPVVSWWLERRWRWITMVGGLVVLLLGATMVFVYVMWPPGLPVLAWATVVMGAALIVLPVVSWWLERCGRRYGVMFDAAVASALPGLDVISGGVRIVGAGCTVVDTRRPRHVRGFVDGKVRQLCRTPSGKWFLLAFHVRWGEVCGLAAAPAIEAEARHWLEGQPGKYRTYFGEPDIL